MTKEYPLITTTEEAQSFLQGRKTRFSRPVKPQPIDNTEVDGNFYEGNHKGYVKVDGHPNWREQFAYEFCPFGSLGDLIYVRETITSTAMGGAIYKAGGKVTLGKTLEDMEWIDWDCFSQTRPTIPAHQMPKSAARIWLLNEGVTVKRVQEVTEEEAREEGVKHIIDKITGYCGYNYEHGGYNLMTGPWQGFVSKWRKEYGQESYDRNPWLWSVKVRVLSTNGKPK